MSPEEWALAESHSTRQSGGRVTIQKCGIGSWNDQHHPPRAAVPGCYTEPAHPTPSFATQRLGQAEILDSDEVKGVDDASGGKQKKTQEQPFS